jgi:hypothetical protein
MSADRRAAEPVSPRPDTVGTRAETGGGRVHRVRRPTRTPPRIERLHSLATEHALLVDRLEHLGRSSSCLDVRTAAAERLRQLRALDTAGARSRQDDRRLRIELRTERSGLDGFGCRHVVDASRSPAADRSPGRAGADG